jgi:integrase
MLIGTKEPGELNSVCEVNTSINQFPALGLRLKLNVHRVNLEKQSTIGNMIRERNSSLSLWMKISYHGRGQASAVTARMISALLRSRLSFGEKHLGDIKPMMIETFKREWLSTPTKHDKEDRPRPRTPASVNRDLACLSKILSMAFDNELIDSNPMRRVRLLKENSSRERFITAEEEKRLFAQLTGRRDHIRSVVTIALNTGMRRGEILGLRWEHVNSLARTVFIAKSKTGRTRTIPISDVVFKELMTLKQDSGPKEFVFSNSRTGVNIDSIKTGWRNACEKAGLVILGFTTRVTPLLRGLEPMEFTSGIFEPYSVMRRCG